MLWWMLLAQSAVGTGYDQVRALAHSDEGSLEPVDAQGRVVRTWREGDGAVARCIEAGFAGTTVFVPPKAPFHAAFEFQGQP